ncbi:MAG TPA: alpha-galactosidase, partial [Candidatus Limnocylindria bacterium]|nr:alpha-galactosidase [Candidatus Limnocylindria bacterium]
MSRSDEEASDVPLLSLAAVPPDRDHRMTRASPLVVLRAAGTSIVLDVEGPGLPRVLHWGADLGDCPDEGVLTAAAPVPPSSLDAPWPLTLLPLREDGWTGSPGVEGHRGGQGAPWSLRLSAVEYGGGRLRASATDPTCGVDVTVELVLEPSGVLRVRGQVINTGADALDVAAVRLLMPLPPRAGEILDQTGRWAREAAPQRLPLVFGGHRRAARRGRSGHDGPLLLVAGTSGFGFRSGEVWGAHVAWSGDREHLVERLPEGAGGHASVLGGGELLAPGEVRLGPGATYSSPWVHLVWSASGLDGLSTRLHQMLRARPAHPRTPRPLVLNTWEAVYFDHDLDRLVALADAAADMGVERFVLDDGWFLGRRDDRRGLGDWTVDPVVWPGGLHPLVDHVRHLGLQFGLWVEPEMVNLDSDLARAHPDWVLGPPQESSVTWRTQHVLDVARPDVFAHLLER